MNRKNKWYIAGTALILVIGVFIVFVFSLLGTTKVEDLFLHDTSEQNFGWSYELLVNDRAQTYEPEFADDGYTLILPEGTEAVRITRTMTEDTLGAELQWISYSDGVELSLDEELLHTDFPKARRGGDGFLRPSKKEWNRLLRNQSKGRIQVRMTLPANYTGRELSMTTYFAENGQIRTPEFPYLGTEDSYKAPFVVASFSEYAAAVFYAILTVVTAGVFLLDIYSGNAHGRTLLLCLYFALLFLNHLYDSPAALYSALSSWEDLAFLYGIYIAPLYLYLTLRLTKWWKYLLCAGIGSWVIYECVRRFQNIRQGLIINYGYTGKWTFILILALAAAFLAEGLSRNGRRRWRKKLLPACGLTAAVTVVYLLSKINSFGSIRGFLTDGIWMSLCYGYYEPFVNAVTDIASYMTLILVTAEAVRRTTKTRRTMDVLREREQQSVENYHHLLAAQEATSALRHEMRHHFNALAGILDSRDVQRASDYVAAVSGEFEQLPKGYYSQNILVNVIAGNYLDRARALGIQTEHHLDIPKTLAVADEDLSVFLSNMLQNALEACEKMSPDAERFIRVEMRLKGDFLFIKCVNSCDETDAPADKSRSHPEHGYGLAAMRRVAEKYGSVLLINSTGKTFEVRSCFCLKKSA